MQLTLKDDLPFTKITVAYQGTSIEIANVLVDTGSATTVLSTDAVNPINIKPLPDDIIHFIRGVGGKESVFNRRVDFIQVGEHRQNNFDIDVTGLDYGFEINGILGMDFLRLAGSVIDLNEMNISFVH